MRRFPASAALAAIAISSPAAARDGSGNFGVEAGVAFPRDSDDTFIATLSGLEPSFSRARPRRARSCAISSSDIDLDEAVGSLAFMLNGLIDVGDQDGLSF